MGAPGPHQDTGGGSTEKSACSVCKACLEQRLSRGPFCDVAAWPCARQNLRQLSCCFWLLCYWRAVPAQANCLKGSQKHHGAHRFRAVHC